MASLRPDQVADLAFYISNQKCLNLSEAGTGKTPSVAAMQEHLWKQHGIGTVFVQPKSLLAKNRLEILRFTGFADCDVVIVDGSKAKINTILNSGAKVFLMGFRRLTLSWRQLPAYVKAVHVDELHMGYKSADSQQSNALFEMFDTGRMSWFLGMTGTLIDGKLSSAYPAIRVIEPRYYRSSDGVGDRHAVRDLDGNIFAWKNHKRLARLLARHAIKRTFADVYGDQPVVHIPQLVDMERRQRNFYDRFHDQAVLEFETFIIDGTAPGVAFARARQLMEHPNRFPDLSKPGGFIDILDGDQTGKEELLKVHLEEHDLNEKPLIVFTPLIAQQTRVAALLDEHKLSYSLINGSLLQNQRNKASEDFVAGHVQVMLATPQTAAFGHNWQFSGRREVDHIIFMALDFGDATFIQARQRAIRGKRTSPLRLTTFEYRHSLDQHICKLIHRKSVDASKVDPTRPILRLSGMEPTCLAKSTTCL